MNTLIEYLEGLTIIQGRLAGQPFPLFPWERRFVNGAFRSGVSEAALSVGRGNGKTTLVAGLGAAAVDGPLAVPRAETLLVASSFEQGRISFEHILAFLRERHGAELDNKSKWRIWDTAQQARISNRSNGATVRCLGSDPRRAHGAAPSLILLDEPAQWPDTSSDRMLAALRTAAGKQPTCRLIALGTLPADKEHWFSKMLFGGADYSQVHAAGKEAPKFQARTWHKANPSLRYLPDLLDAIRRESAKAKRDPAVLASFEALRLNLGTTDTLRSVLLGLDTWLAIEGEAPREGGCVWGIDLGTSAAQSAIAAFWPDTGRLECMAAFPTEPTLEERGLRDGVGKLYDSCYRRGELIQVGGAAVSVIELVQAAQERYGAPFALASDRWREAELRDALKGAGLPLAKLELRGQGFRDGAEDVRAFVRWCLEGKVTPLPSMLLTSAVGEARTVADQAGNAKLAKGVEGGRRLRARDDAAAAGILAVALASRQPKRRHVGRSLGLA